MQPRTLRQLPAHYHEVFYFQVTEQWLLLNLAAIILMAFNLVVFGGALLAYHVGGAPWVLDSLPQSLPSGLGILLMLAVLPLHEWLHGLGMSFFGHRPRYGIKPLKGVLYASADGAFFWRNQFVMVALAPLLAISALATFLCLFFPLGISLWLMFAAALNATGAIGDLWMTYLAFRFPTHSIFRDEEDGMRVFAPTISDAV